MDVSTNSNLNRFQTNDVSQIARHDIDNREELEKRVRDTFKPTKDSFEKMAEQTVIVCDCYTNYQITTHMPESVFSDSFGYTMQHDIADRMEDYYAGKMSDDELKQYFNDCCSDMRIYRAQKHQTSGNVEEDNMQIVSQIYEIFAKENARAASNANYNEGTQVNASYGNKYRNDDWVYYNTDYYYQCEEVKDFLGAAANAVAEKWGIGAVDTQEIEKNSKFTLDGGFDFNSVWNFTYRNQVGRASIADEAVEPPKDFKFFYKEHVDNKAKMELWMGRQKKSIDVLFYITPDSLKGQLYNADELMKDFYGETDRAKEFSVFMEQLSLFTRWYSWESGINNRFGNFIPDAFHQKSAKG
ncbi:MAG: hypothetical protein K2K17_07230 [Lachnospiraceae bacterium]|nr:hypothetical protein [Lachnospiraceae bacterium]